MVYPRACGGTTEERGDDGAIQGLSPRVRGNPSTGRRRYERTGSIPARAGEPRVDQERAAVVRVYPRACGGTWGAGHRPAPRGGLSPRVRGNHQAPHAHRPVFRSIPARAGEPTGWPVVRGQEWVYPRACGGTSVRSSSVIWALGLSPRVRGNRLIGRLQSAEGGSIPARAGEPRVLLPTRRGPRVYPRACGGTRA